MDPELFGKYRILSKLAGGGMGRVYLALETETNQRVALKLIDEMPDPESQEVLEAERKGAILQARLCGIDDRVAQIFDIGNCDGYLYIAMEYIEGRDLSEMLATGPLPPEDAVAIAIDVCGVLTNAHTFRAVLDDHEYHGIVHGDIKPRNIRITSDGHVKVLDFGIAKALSLTRKYTVNQFGSVPYSSPERLNSGEVDASSDVWAAGVVLYEMLVGHPYFQADTPSKVEHLIRNYNALGNSFDKIPPQLRGILAKALDPRADRRYQTARALQMDLERFSAATVRTQNGIDIDATRRTTRNGAADVDDKTRRTTTPADAPTVKSAPAFSGPVPPPATQKKPASAAPIKTAKPAVTGFRRRVPLLIRLSVVLLMSIAMINEGRVWRKAAELERSLQSERTTDLNAAWDQYQVLSQRSYLPGATTGLKKAILNKLTADAERTISQFRESDTTTVYLKDWQAAQSELARALELSPNDKEIRGKLRLIEGHISRINAGNVSGGKSWTDARIKFGEAADLLGKSPDPHLGFARLYLVAPRDVDKAEDEFHEAERRGYRVSRRDRAMLADAYRLRGEGALRAIPDLPSAPQQSDYLNRADTDFARSEDLFRDIVPYSNSVSMLRRIAADRDAVSKNKEILRQP
jgi:serine/threonine protein kinase